MEIFSWFIVGCLALAALALLVTIVLLPFALVLGGVNAVLQGFLRPAR